MVTRTQIPPLAEYFKDVEDPRIERKKLYPLTEVILIALLAVMSGGEGWEDMEDSCSCEGSMAEAVCAVGERDTRA